MKIWIDILTPKQLLFAEPIVERFGKKHKILCTSRDYEVSKLAKIRHFSLVKIGRHGGESNLGKLEASILRMQKMTKKIKAFGPEMTISFCSPEASRISFGLGIRHIAFCDSPHAEAVMRLTLPLIQKLLIPSVIPKKEFSKFGISEKDIISYKAIDASVTARRKTIRDKKTPFRKNGKKNILIRVEEEQASYAERSSKIIPIIRKVITEFGGENIVILGRYPNQISNLQKIVGSKARVIRMSFDGKDILEDTDVFIGSGGTMTAESALLGVPTISYNAVPNLIEDYLVKNRIATRETDPQKIVKNIKKILKDSKEDYQSRARKIHSKMEDPIQKLDKLIS